MARRRLSVHHGAVGAVAGLQLCQTMSDPALYSWVRPEELASMKAVALVRVDFSSLSVQLDVMR